jgi:hypothetical protein
MEEGTMETMTLEEFVAIRYGADMVEASESHAAQAKRVLGKDIMECTRDDVELLAVDAARQERVWQAFVTFVQWMQGAEEDEAKSAPSMLRVLDEAMKGAGFPVVAEPPVPITNVLVSVGE